jgi:hypothetical protein
MFKAEHASANVGVFIQGAAHVYFPWAVGAASRRRSAADNRSALL